MSQSLPETLSCDVAIVGYGPVGMALAALLAQEGMNAVVLERFATRYNMPRACHSDGETMRTFQRLGVSTAFEKISRPALRYELVTARHEVLATIPFGEGRSGWKDEYFFHQPQMEDILHKRLEDLGVQVFMGATVEDVTQTAEGATVFARRTTAEAGSAKTRIEAKFVVGCDGAGSVVRGLIGSERRDLGFPSIDQLVIDFEHIDPDIDIEELQEIYQVLDIQRPHMACRYIGPRWTRWEFSRNNGETRAWLESEETSWKLIAPWNITPKQGKIKRRAIYTFESSLSTKWREGRVLLAGDAAHTMPPFMGQGWCTGVRDAVNLSWKLAAIMRNQADLSLLDTYQLEREKHTLRFIEMSASVGRNVQLQDPEAARKRDDILRAGAVPSEGPLPRLHDGIVRSPKDNRASVADGRLAPQARVLHEDRIEKLDDIVGPGWKVISRHHVSKSMFNSKQSQLISSLGLRFLHISRGACEPGSFVDIDGEFDGWYYEHQRKAFIQRPDDYIFGAVSTNEDLPELLDELAAKLSGSGWRLDTECSKVSQE